MLEFGIHSRSKLDDTSMLMLLVEEEKQREVRGGDVR